MKRKQWTSCILQRKGLQFGWLSGHRNKISTVFQLYSHMQWGTIDGPHHTLWMKSLAIDLHTFGLYEILYMTPTTAQMQAHGFNNAMEIIVTRVAATRLLFQRRLLLPGSLIRTWEGTVCGCVCSVLASQVPVNNSSNLLLLFTGTCEDATANMEYGGGLSLLLSTSTGVR